MPGYCRERLELFQSLIKKRPGLFNGKEWTLDPRELRFKHGETIAELKVPYHMGGEDETCVEEAVLALITLLSKRFEPQQVQSDAGKEAALISVGALKDKTFRTDLFITDSLEKEIASLVLSTTPYMDSAILANWLGSDGHGRRFIRWVAEYFEKIMKEETRFGAEERTAYLALLALVNTIRKKKEKAKSVRIKGLTYEKIDLAVGLVMFTALRSSVAHLLEELRESRATCYKAQTAALLSTVLAPKPLLAIPANLVSYNINPYGLSAETLEALSSALEPVGEGSDLEALLAAALPALRKDTAAMDAARAQSEVNRFRHEAFSYLTEFDLQGTEAQSILYEVYNEDRLVKNFLSDQRSIASLSAALDDVKRRYAKDQRRTEIIDSFLRFLSSFKKSMLGGLWGGAKRQDEAAQVVEGYYALSLDDHVERYFGPMRTAMADRRGEYKQNTILEEYNRGRLYRFSKDDRPVLKTLAVEEEGQLFIDMKDFSRKTLKVKEIAMADFMREHFYKPILNAAGRYRMGTGIGSDERGIRLTNIPGDAAIFSGSVTYLVSLAKDIQQVIRRYRDELMKRLPPRKDDEILEEVHERFEARRDALKQKRAELNASLAANEPGIEPRLVALGEEEHRLENTYREELEAAIKGELEAGLYISYGAKAETMVIEPKEDFSEPVSVSIGEKINEASRGTFRNPLVRAKLELLLENERAKRKNKNLKYPFDVYIDRVLSVKLPPELDSAFDRLIAARKETNAKAMAQVMANEFYSDLNRIISGEPFSALRVISSTTDIYNKGEALSMNALEAYIRENRGSRWFFRKTVRVDELDPSIQEPFFFPSGELDIWFSHESVRGADRVEAFCRCGEVIFKGFEANTPMAIYELLNPEGELLKALVKCHFHKWLEESKQGAAAEAL